MALLTVDVDSTEYPIKANNNREAFAKSVKRGRAFEQWERSRWTAADHAPVEYEARTQWKGKRRRVDLRLSEESDEPEALHETDALGDANEETEMVEELEE